MSINHDDLISSLLSEQARLNSAVDDGDINTLVADVFGLTGEVIGVSETWVAVAFPHLIIGSRKYDDEVNSKWESFSWD